jgi:PAS domain S-box-containing protein
MERAMQKFFQLSKDLLLVGTKEGRAKKISPSWSEVLGWTEEEILNTPAPMLVHPDDLDVTANSVKNAIDDGKDVFSFENRYRHKKGHWVWLLWNGSYSRGDDLIYAMAKDITHIKRFEDELMASEKRLKEAQKMANIGNWEINFNKKEPDGNPTVIWSEQVYRIFGYEPGAFQVSQESFFKHVHPDDHEKLKKALQKAVKTGMPYEIVHRILLPDGSERTVHEKTQVFIDEVTNKTVSVIGTVQDITQQTLLMNQLIAAQKMESMGRLTGGIAHDFNTLLAAVYGNIEMMERVLTEDHPAYTYMLNILTTTRRAADLTNQLLAFSRHRMQTPTVENLNSLVGEARTLLERVLGSNIEFNVKLAEDMGWVEVESGQIIQIIMNLAVNARDAMPRGGTLKIETSEAVITDREEVRPGLYARLVVSDTGHGMDQETLSKIYEPFFTTKQPGQGTGLGLSTVYGIVKQSQGHIFVESEPHKGTTFEILLPIVQKKPAQQPAPVERAPVRLAGNGQRLLLIEDEIELRLILKEVLEKDGYEVLVADSGRSGLQLIRDQKDNVDLLLTDIVLPGISGIELIETMQKLRPQIPVICITGYTSRDVHTDIPNVTVMTKPFYFPALLEKIRDLLASAKMHQRPLGIYDNVHASLMH